MTTCQELIAEGQSAPVEGWDFSWLDGRATEARPPWGYARQVVSRIAAAPSVLDIQTGGGEVFAEVLGKAARSHTLVGATEGWPPNVPIARRNLAPFEVEVVEIDDAGEFPFATESFDLVISRHPTIVVWDEVQRVLRRGGSYFAQHIGPGTNWELTDFMMGAQPVSDERSPRRAIAQAGAAGLTVENLQEASLRLAFGDIGAVVYFLRKVVWTVPDFTVERYRDRLILLHQKIQRDGPFISHAKRFLIEARKPSGPPL